MTADPEGPAEKLGRLVDALVRDVDQLSDDELFKEAAEQHGSLENAIAFARSKIALAVAEGGRRRLLTARKAYDAHIAPSRPNVTRISAEQKRVLLEHFASNDNALQRKLTLAARNEANSEADIDSFLEDLVELGIIDDEGNIR